MSQNKTIPTLSADTKNAVDAFELKDAELQKLLQEFRDKHEAELEELEKLMESRNSALDNAKRKLREEAFSLPYPDVKSVVCGPFRVVKKWSASLLKEMFLEKLEIKNLTQKAKEAGAIVETVEIPYEEAKAFVKAHGIEKEFLPCEDGKELTPMVFGPKPLSPLGTPQKD